MPFRVGRRLFDNVPRLAVVPKTLFYVPRHPGPHGEIHAPPQVAASKLLRPRCHRECQPSRWAAFLSRRVPGMYDRWCTFATRYSVLNSLSPLLITSVCRVGRYLSHLVFSVLCHVFSQLARLALGLEFG